jgi:thymidylate kinase
VLRATEPFRQWSGRRGLLVAVLGPDGAGKSTLLEAVDHTWPWPVRRVYLGLWPDAHGTTRVAGVLWPLRRPFRAMARYGIGWWAGLRGRLVLFDRYVYDAAAPPRGRHRTLKRWYFRVLLGCVPAPDVAVLLEAPGEVLHARKGEMTPSVLDANRVAISQHVHAVARRSGRPRVVVVDATQDRTAVAADVVAALWRLAADRLQEKTEGGPR